MQNLAVCFQFWSSFLWLRLDLCRGLFLSYGKSDGIFCADLVFCVVSGAVSGAADQPETAWHQCVPNDLFHAGGGFDRRRLASVAVHL